MTKTELRAHFDTPKPLTIKLKKKTMLLNPKTFELTPMANLVETSTKRELPTSQLELITAPHHSVAKTITKLTTKRRALTNALQNVALPTCTNTHPNATLDILNKNDHYETIARKYNNVTHAQLIYALQMHITIDGTNRTLTVYNALHSHLPKLATLTANAPFHNSRNTNLASVQPLISTLLPQQGVPPAIPS